MSEVVTQDQDQHSAWTRGIHQPERTAVIDDAGTPYTYGWFSARANQWANALQAAGVGPGERVCLAAQNSPDYLVVVLACMQIGVRLVPVNFHLTQSDIEYILADSGARAVVVDPRVPEALSAAQADSTAEIKLVLGEVDGFESAEKFIAAAPETLPPHRQPGQRMYYTSGTTGRPKGVVKPQPSGDPDTLAIEGSRNLFSRSGREVSSDGVTLVSGPLYHAAPLGAAVGALHLGQTAVLMGKWDPLAFLTVVQEHRVTSATMVPTMFERLLKLPEEVRATFDISSLRVVTHAGAPCAPATKRAMIEWFGPILNEFYAASEGGGTMVTSAEWLDRPGTVGRPAANSAILILDDDDRPVPAGVVGRVFMKLREPFEYHNDSEKTGRAIVGDFFTAGDIGYVDDDGYLFLSDRSADVIISGGVNIYPAEIEAEVNQHPAVADVAVIGVPNPEWGEEVKAVVQLVQGSEPTQELAEELIAFCREHLAKFKVPRSVDFDEDLPRSDSGKLYKRLIRERYWTGGARRI
jgi:long-chain acyl-CoA synthetase